MAWYDLFFEPIFTYTLVLLFGVVYIYMIWIRVVRGNVNKNKVDEQKSLVNLLQNKYTDCQQVLYEKEEMIKKQTEELEKLKAINNDLQIRINDYEKRVNFQEYMNKKDLDKLIQQTIMNQVKIDTITDVLTEIIKSITLRKVTEERDKND